MSDTVKPDKPIDPKKHERLRKQPTLRPHNTELAKPDKTRNPDIEDPAGEPRKRGGDGKRKRPSASS